MLTKAGIIKYERDDIALNYLLEKRKEKSSTLYSEWCKISMNGKS